MKVQNFIILSSVPIEIVIQAKILGWDGLLNPEIEPFGSVKVFIYPWSRICEAWNPIFNQKSEFKPNI